MTEKGQNIMVTTILFAHIAHIVLIIIIIMFIFHNTTTHDTDVLVHNILIMYIYANEDLLKC